MIDEIRANISTSYTLLIFDFADLEGVNKVKLEAQLKHPLVELFDKQKNADRAKKNLKADFRKLVALYFNEYQNATGFDFSRLQKKLDENESVFIRHLGKDKVRYVRLLISQAKIIQEKQPRGLLGVA